jgi:hypothetical protein
MKPALVVAQLLGLLAFSWALVTAADARNDAKPETVAYRVVAIPEETEPSPWEKALAVETPLSDALVDFDELERQTDCLWEYLKASGVEITLEIVLAAGTWTDALGGACFVIGEDDE